MAPSRPDNPWEDVHLCTGIIKGKILLPWQLFKSTSKLNLQPQVGRVEK